MIDTLLHIQPREYWQVGEDGLLGTVAKPRWICCLAQVEEFANVLYCVRNALGGEIGEDKRNVYPAITILADRYEHLTSRMCWLNRKIADIYLWIIDYAGENGMQRMMADIRSRARDIDFHSRVWNAHARYVAASDDLLKREYDFDGMVEKIKKAHEEGKKTRLFIGRQPHEPLPSVENGEAEEDEVWASADIYINGPIPEDRIHIWLDFNPTNHGLQDGVRLLQGLFDEVVVDLSTAKNLCNDFAKRFGVMLRNDESTLIFEATALRVISPRFDEPSFSPASYAVSVSYLHNNEEVVSWGHQQLEKHLKTLFHHVELHTEETFPYQSRYSTDKGAFFVVKQPKGE